METHLQVWTLIWSCFGEIVYLVTDQIATCTAPKYFLFVNINKDCLTASFLCFFFFVCFFAQFINTLLASTRDFGTYRISEQLRLRRGLGESAHLHGLA